MLGDLYIIQLMVNILHYLNDPRLSELWYMFDYGYCRVYIINPMLGISWEFVVNMRGRVRI